MRRIVFYIAFIEILFCSFLAAQTVQETFEIGHRAYEAGNLELAQKHFDRVVYFSKDSTRYVAHKFLGDIHLEKGDYQSALTNYTFAQNFSKGRLGEADDLTFEKTRLWISLGNPNLAYAETFNLSDNSEIQKEKLLFQGFALYEAAKFRESKAHYMLLVAEEDKIQLIRHFNEAVKLYNRSDNMYRNLSYVFPGLGQAMNGNYLDALNSFVLVGGLAGVLLYTGFAIGWFDGGLAVLPWLYRYYKGGAENASNMAKEYKRNQLHLIHLQILDLIEQDQAVVD